MKSFLVTLGALALAVTPGISLVTNATSSSATTNQQEGKVRHFWNARKENEVELHSWYVYDTEPSYQNIFLTKIDLTAKTDNQLTSVNQIDNLDLITNPNDIPPLGFPASFVTRSYTGNKVVDQEFLDKDENSVMNQFATSSLAKKLSGNLGDESTKALYDGAQYTVGTWDITNAANVRMQAAMKVGLAIYPEKTKLTLAIWGSLFVKSAPSEYWLGGLSYVPIGESVQINYKH